MSQIYRSYEMSHESGFCLCVILSWFYLREGAVPIKGIYAYPRDGAVPIEGVCLSCVVLPLGSLTCVSCVIGF
jgi:hypothetical protein